MRHLYIIGARGCGRETFHLFRQCELQDVECMGFLDDKEDSLDGFDGYPPIISSVESYLPEANDVFVCALGDPKWVRHYSEIIRAKGGKFISLISPLAIVSENTIIGEGCIINSLCIISPDVRLGDNVYVGAFCTIGHDAVVENYCHIGAYGFLGGGAVIEECATLHPRVNILPHKKVGENAVIGASSVVIRNVSADTTVFGIPAKKI